MKNTFKNIALPLFFCFFIFSIKANETTILKGKEFVSLEIKYDPKATLALGHGINIGIAATTDKGKVLETPGFLAPGLLKTTAWTNFKVEVEGGRYEDGVVFISGNFSDIKNHEIKIKAFVKDKPELKNEISIKLTYSGTIYAVFDGKKGKHGSNGSMGNTGGNSGSNQKATDGTPGGDGQQGGDGTDGENVDVYLKLTFDEILKKDMLQVYCVSKTTGKKQFIYLDPEASKFIVTVNGGDGGSGGEGGRGGDCGFDPRSENPNLTGGKGGTGGSGGNGGNGGQVTLHIDPNTEKINTEISFSRAGGSAGKGGGAGYQGQKNQGVGKEGPAGASGQNGHSGNQGAETIMLQEKVNVDFATVRNSNTNTVVENKTNESSKVNSTINNNSNVNTNVVSNNSTVKSDEFPNGPYSAKREDGTLKVSGEYKNNKKTGTWKWFNEDGKTVAKQIEYGVDGAYKETEWGGNNGKITSAINKNKDGKRNGLTQYYDSNGNLEEEKMYVNDQENGSFKSYKIGKLDQTGQYKNGRKDGDWKTYDETGKVKIEHVYLDGEENGPYKYYSLGKLKKSGQYKNGKKDGVWSSYDDAGKVKGTENYKDGELQK